MKSLHHSPARRRFAHVLALVSAVVCLPLVSSRACQLCTPYPKETTADLLLKADAVVLAREDPARSFQFAAIEVLKGDPGDHSIDLFLDSATRRILAAEPERSVVLTLNKADCDPDEEDCGLVTWQRIGVADDEFGPVVRQILAAGKEWLTDPDSRYDFFAGWLGHANIQLRHLAHLEIARAPYRRILECRDEVSREEIYRLLGNVRYIEWHPLYILLLAAKNDPADHERIRKSFYSCARYSTATTLQAWAAAYIEIAGAEAIDSVEEHYFQRSDRTREEIRAVIQALSVHGSRGHVHLRDRIMASYAVLLKSYPQHAADLLKDLESWKRTDFRTTIAAIVSKPPKALEPQCLRQLRSYHLQQMRGGLRTARSPLRP